MKADPTAAPLDAIPALATVLGEARLIAQEFMQHHLGVEHVVLAWLRREATQRPEAMHRVAADWASVGRTIESAVGRGKDAAKAVPQPTHRMRGILASLPAAEHRPDDAKRAEAALWMGIVQEGFSLPMRCLADQGFDPQALMRAAQVAGGPGGDGDADATRLAAAPSKALPAGHAAPPTAQAGPAIAPKQAVRGLSATPTLDRFGRDLTALARAGKLVDAIGRDAEIDQMIVVLARTQKANPILLGDAGTGKTAIVEGLAWRVANGAVPPILKDRRIVELAMGDLTAGTSLRGQFEERVRAMIKEASAADEVILFIDEIHTLMGAGGHSGDPSPGVQMFKPALARGDVSCIGATTHDEFRRFIRVDPALERRFSPVTIQELAPQATLKVLAAVAERIARKQSTATRVLSIAPAALEAAVALTDRYVKERHQPDKSIDALDLACASAVVHGRDQVGPDDIATVVAEWTGIPANKLTQDQLSRYRDMDNVLAARVIGQQAAVQAVCRSVRTALAGLKPKDRPLGVFLFLGPSGVGKTTLAKELAAELFDSSQALIRFDMNEYQEKHSYTGLVGASQGYVGSEQGGAFTEAVRRRPYSVVLLDEIEKAHPDVLNLFLGVFDEGHIRDNQGRWVDCSNALFVLTSNLGAGEVDFANAGEDELRRVAEKFLRPELVNRLTDVIGFHPLGMDQLFVILDLILAACSRQLKEERGVILEVDQLAKDVLVDEGFDTRMGARPLERAVQRRLIQPIVDGFFAGRYRSGTLNVSARDRELTFTNTP